MPDGYADFTPALGMGMLSLPGPSGTLTVGRAPLPVAEPSGPGPAPLDERERVRRQKLLKKAMDQWTLSSEASSPQRARELADQRFQLDHWPKDIRDERKGSDGVPARPCMEIDKIGQPLQQTVNQMRTSHLSLKVSPKGDGASAQTADVFQGLYRHIEQESRAGLARGWAYERAVSVGRGWYRILTEYSDDGDFDLDIVIRRILNQATVYDDPWAQEMDWSDGEFAFIVEDVPTERIAREYGDSDIGRAIANGSFNSTQFQSIGDAPPGWITDKSIRRAEWYYVEHVKQQLLALADGTKVLASDPGVQLTPDGRAVLRPAPPTTTDGGFGTGPDGQPVPQAPAPLLPVAIVRRRAVDQRTVKHCIITASEILLEEEWDGRYIPIVPVIGREYNVNGDRVYRGMVTSSKDGQFTFDVMASALVETVGLAPKAPYIVYDDQIQQYIEIWRQANTRNFPFLPVVATATGPNGQPYPLPTRNFAEPPVQAIVMALNMADSAIQATTATPEVALGHVDPQASSGRAIGRLQAQSEVANSGYLENFIASSMTLEAKIILDLIPRVYDRAGRIAHLLNEDDEQDAVMVNQPYVKGPGGQPQAVVGDRTDTGGWTNLPDGAIVHMLSQGRYSVAVSVSKAYSTKREEGTEAVGQLLTAAPTLTPLVADLWVEGMDFPKAKAIAKRLRDNNPAATKDEGQPGIPPQAQAQIQQLTAQVQQLTQMTQGKQMDIQARAQVEQMKAQMAAQLAEARLASDTARDQAKMQMQIELKRMDIESRERMTALQIQATLSQTQAQIASEQAIAQINAEMKKLTEFVNLSFNTRQTQADRTHEAALARASAGHEAAQAQADRFHAHQSHAMDLAHDVASQIHAAQMEAEAAPSAPPVASTE